MTDEELFDAHTRDLGGRFPRSRMSQAAFDSSYGHLLDLANGLIGSAREHLPGLPPIYFDFVVDGSFNAYAFKADGRYFIGFNTGTQYLLQLVFFRMLSDTQLFEFIGNASEEKSDIPPLVGYTAHAEQMHRAGVHPTRPRSDVRWSYACDLVRHAVYFLVGHEIAHITRGHVDYLYSKTGIGSIPEVGWAETKAEDAVERQVLEADADRRSTTSAIYSVKLRYDQRQLLGGTRLSVGEMLFDWAFAMNTIFRLFGDVRLNSNAVASYPPLPLRRVIATGAAHSCMVHAWDSNLRETAIKSFRNAAIYTEMAFERILGQENGANGIFEAFSEEGIKRSNELISLWFDTVRPRVAPFAFEGVALERNPNAHTGFVDGAESDALTHELLSPEANSRHSVGSK